MLDGGWKHGVAKEVIKILFGGEEPSKFSIKGGGGPNTVRYDYDVSCSNRDGIRMYSRVMVNTMWCHKIDGRGKTTSTFIDLGWSLFGGITSSNESVSLRALTVVSHSADIHHTIMNYSQTVDYMHELRRMNGIASRVNDILSRGKYKIHPLVPHNDIERGYTFLPGVEQ